MSDPFSPSPTPPPAMPTPAVDASPAVARFKSCRWRRPPEEGPECCGHRDVLPIAGTTGFDPAASCPDLTFLKLRRRPKKRDPDEYCYWSFGVRAFGVRAFGVRAFIVRGFVVRGFIVKS